MTGHVHSTSQQTFVSPLACDKVPTCHVDYRVRRDLTTLTRLQLSVSKQPSSGSGEGVRRATNEIYDVEAPARGLVGYLP